jgi:hypothetical protein
VTVTGAIDSPFLVIDTLQVLGFAVVPTVHSDTVLSGSVDILNDSTLILGLSDTTTWTVASGGVTWLTVPQPAGTGEGYARWFVNPSGLLPATYVDTLTLVTSEADTGRVEVSLVLNAPTIVAACAFDKLARNQCLGDIEQRFLDLTGNGDGVYNLGDFLGFLNRSPQPAASPRRER